MIELTSNNPVTITKPEAVASPRGDDQVSDEVTIEDIIRNWGESDSHADLNDDGIVDVNDLLLLLERQSATNPVLDTLMAAPRAAVEGLASLGGLLADALGLQSSTGDEKAGQSATQAVSLDGLEPGHVDQAMKTAKGLLERWQARGWATTPPPGYEDVIGTLPLEVDVRSVVLKLVEAGYAA
ncbi:MAG: hypothetical protein MK116_03030 [Phycisphaerales bacterium]|nr:hypothetical protein [Phycisphaerales bacterium]